MDEQGGQPAPEMEDVGRCPEGVDVLPGEARPGVGERLVELQRQEEVRAGLDPLQPGADQGRVGRAVERAVDLDDVDVGGEIGQGVEAAPLRERIDDALPILVAPARGADMILGHAADILRPPLAGYNAEDGDADPATPLPLEEHL